MNRITSQTPNSQPQAQGHPALRAERRLERDVETMLRDIAFRSVCEHHLLPFRGRAHIAYLPGEQVVGLGALPKVVETCGYYLNPFEWWAYSRDDHWPPHGIVGGLGWKQPAVQPFAARAVATASADA